MKSLTTYERLRLIFFSIQLEKKTIWEKYVFSNNAHYSDDNTISSNSLLSIFTWLQFLTELKIFLLAPTNDRFLINSMVLIKELTLSKYSRFLVLILIKLSFEHTTPSAATDQCGNAKVPLTHFSKFWKYAITKPIFQRRHCFTIITFFNHVQNIHLRQ